MDQNQKRLLALAGIGVAALGYRLTQAKPRYEFDGKVILITGGSRGLGLAMARQFATERARLAIVARDGDELARAESDLRGRGAEVLAFTADVRDQDQARGAVERVVSHFGRIDVLINNAGVIQVGPVEHMQVSDFENAMAVHFYGPLYTMLAAAPHMREQGEGRIVNISSIGGKIAVPHLVPYSSSKFALVGLSDGMRAELAQHNIKVTTVCPGLMRTGSHYNALFKGQHEQELAWFSLFDALPVSSIDAERAARQIVEACRSGAPQLVISIQAKLLATFAPPLPGPTAAAMKLMRTLLPDPTGAEGDQLKTGWDSQSKVAPSLLTRPADEATEELNGLRGHPPITS